MTGTANPAGGLNPAGGSATITLAATTQTLLGAHLGLPLAGNKQAPKRFTGCHRDVERFLEHFEYLCTVKNISDPQSKCLGILRYCSNDVIDLIESTEEFAAKDFDALAQKIKDLYDGARRKAERHIGQIQDFMEMWVTEEVQALQVFRQYHREFIRVAGPLKIGGRIDENEYNRAFWGGLHQDTRDRLERRMTDDEPGLDLTVPFPIQKIVKAAEHIFNRDRFDKHLREGGGMLIGSEERSPSWKKKHRRRHERDSDSEEDDARTDSDSDHEESTPSWRKKKRQLEKAKAMAMPSKKQETPERKKDTDEITDLVQRMEGLSIDKPQYRTYFVRLTLLAPQVSALYDKPLLANPRSYATREAYPPDDGPRSYVTREPRFAPPGEGPRRDIPPHQVPAPFERRYNDPRDQVCFGCGGKGHRMNQCGKLDALIHQRHVCWIQGKLRWADGSNIIREPEETWANAITRRVQQTNSSTTTKEGHNGEVYFVEVNREESDADTEDQEELGWASGSIGSAAVEDLQAYALTRSNKVSREARKDATNSPHRPHRMKDLTSRRQLEGLNRKQGAVPQNTNFNGTQDRLQTSTAPAPIDISPRKFEGKLDGEFIPMETDEDAVEHRINHHRKMTARDLERPTRHVIQTRAKTGKAQSEVITDIMNLPLTLRVRDIACISPNVRKDLAGTLKAIRDDVMEENDMAEGEEKVAEEGEKAKGKECRPGGVGKASREVKAWRVEEIEEPEGVETQEGGKVAKGCKKKGKSKTGLLWVQATIGKATMMGVVDSGSMVNMISYEQWERTGLPSVPLGRGEELRVTGVNGATSRCKAWIPNARLYLTMTKLETFGDLYILEGADCPLIYGWPWGVDNELWIQERKEKGTFVSWVTDEVHWEVKGSESKDMEEEGRMAVVSQMQNKGEVWEYDKPVAAFTIRIAKRSGTDRSYEPDSEEERGRLEYWEEGPSDLDDEEQMAKTVQWATETAAAWAEKKEGRTGKKGREDQKEEVESAGDEEKGSGEEDRLTSPPPNQLNKGKEREREESLEAPDEPPQRRKGVRPTKGGIITVDRNLEEEFTRMTQDGADNHEWDRFWDKEKLRMSKRKRQWLDWIEEDSDNDPPTATVDTTTAADSQTLSESGDRPRNHTPYPQSPPSVLGPSRQTEPTPAPENPTQKPSKRAKTTDGKGTRTHKVAVRRSCRLRYATTCGICGGVPLVKNKSYRRNETLSRTITKKERLKATAPDHMNGDTKGVKISSYCLRVQKEDSDDEEPPERRTTGTPGQPKRQPDMGTGLTTFWRNRNNSGESGAERASTQTLTRRSRVLTGPRDASLGQVSGIPNAQPTKPTETHWRFPLPPPMPFMPYPPSRNEKPASPRSAEAELEEEGADDGLSIFDPALVIVDELDGLDPKWIRGAAQKGQTRINRTRPDSEVNPYHRPIQPMEETEGDLSIFEPALTFVEEPLSFEPQWTERNLGRETSVHKRPRPDSEVDPYHVPRRQTDRKTKRQGWMPGTEPSWNNSQPYETSSGERAGGSSNEPYPRQRRQWQPNTSMFAAQLPVSVYPEGEVLVKEALVDQEAEGNSPTTATKSTHEGVPTWSPKTKRATYEEVTDERSEVTIKGKKAGTPWESAERKRGCMSEQDSPRQETRTHSYRARLRQNKGNDRKEEGGEVTRIADCGTSEKAIKPKKTPRKTHLPNWPQKPYRQLKRKTSTLLLILLLILSSPCNPLRPLCDPTTCPYMTNLSRLGGPTRCFLPTDRQRASPEGPLSDVNAPLLVDHAKNVLDTIEMPDTNLLTPGLITTQHLVPLAANISQSAREWLGKGTTVCYRLPSGKHVQVRGDSHLRLFAQGLELGWDVSDPPSRRELSILREILFREYPHQDVMRRLHAEWKETQIREPTPGEVVLAGSYDQEDVLLSVIDIGERAPPNTPAQGIKIGPPRSKKPGKGTATAHASQTTDPRKAATKLQPSQVPTLSGCSSPPQSRTLSDESAASALIKIEEDDDPLYKLEAFSPIPVAAPSEPTKVWASFSTPHCAGGKDGDVANESSAHPLNPSTRDNTSTAITSTHPGRSSEEILGEIASTLATLRRDFRAALDMEIKRVINEVEIGAGRILELKEVSGKKRETKDNDGDIEMDGNTPSSSVRKAPNRRPSTPMPLLMPLDLDDSTDPTAVFIKDIADLVDKQ